MVTPPSLDGRGRDDLRDEIINRAPYYLPSWDPDADGAGTALVDLFAELAGELTDSVDQLPRKHRTQLYDELGFNRRPPQSATVPVAFTIASDAAHPVAIPSNTELDADEEQFRIGEEHAFEATPAEIEAVYSTDPASDRLVNHLDVVDGGPATTCFVGEDIQEHHCYIGDPNWLAVSADSAIALKISTDDADPRDVTWEYFAAEDDTEGWIAFDVEDSDWSEGRLELTPSTDLLETEVNGIESYWIRGVLPEEDRPADVPLGVTDIAFQGVRNHGNVDALYANDVPKAPDADEIELFGAIPQLRDACYIASQEAFTKVGAEATITVGESGLSLADEGLDLSWEYFDGNAWRLLPGVELWEPADADLSVTFDVPNDVTETAVSGTEDVWIRARLVGGTFVEHQFTNAGNQFEEDPPAITDIAVSYEYSAASSPGHVLRWNANAYDRPSFDGETTVNLFEPLTDGVQTLYLGIDRPLDGGPYQFYLDLGDRAYDDRFGPRVRWEYYTAVDGWRPVTVTDGTEGLRRAGIVRCSFDPAMSAIERFGHHTHWIRARVRGDQFLAGDPGETSVSLRHHRSQVPIDPRLPEERRPDLEPWHACRGTLETDHGGGDGRYAPVCHGIYPNTTMAEHVKIVEERLGSSDGRPSQTFTVEQPPVIDLELWVEEAATITDEELDQLQTERGSAVEIEWARDGSPRSVWIRWTSVTDIETSDADDRHYTVDLVDGELAFGDGEHGRIPPSGKENLRVTYRTGGGNAGNVPPDAIEDLAEPITHVDEVRNPVESGGGSDEETTTAVRERAPAHLRSRDRAVTAADYEHLALDAAREVAIVRCIRDMDETGERVPGWVTVLIVPEDPQDPPKPSVALRDRVASALAERAPYALVADDRLVVRGPTYVDAAVTATIVVDGVASQSAFEATVRDRLKEFFHPLTGNGDDGWSFGELPTISAVIAVLERLDPVDHIPDIRLSYGEEATITPGEAPPHVAPDVLLTSGTHAIDVQDARQEAR